MGLEHVLPAFCGRPKFNEAQSPDQWSGRVPALNRDLFNSKRLAIIPEKFSQVVIHEWLLAQCIGHTKKRYAHPPTGLQAHGHAQGSSVAWAEPISRPQLAWRRLPPILCIKCQILHSSEWRRIGERLKINRWQGPLFAISSRTLSLRYDTRSFYPKKSVENQWK